MVSQVNWNTNGIQDRKPIKTNNQKMKQIEKLFNGKFNGHQGDVQIFSLSEIPSGCKKIAKTFIAKSEKSGHAHALCGDYELMELPGKGHVVVVGSDGCTLNHTGYQNLTEEYWDKNKVLKVADHQPTILGKGVYFFGIQKRKKHFSKVFEKVKD